MDERERVRLYLDGSPTKTRIVRLLGEKPRYLTDLAQALGVKPPTIFQHGEELVQLGVVRKEHVQGKAYLVLTRFGRDVL